MILIVYHLFFLLSIAFDDFLKKLHLTKIFAYVIMVKILFLGGNSITMEPGSIVPRIVFLVVLIVFSAYFSATETAFSTLNRIRLKNAADNGDKKAGKILKLAENYDKLITTVLVGNNIVNILASSIATVLFISILKDSNLGSTVSTVVMTVVVLIFGEVCPKSLAKESPEKFAKFAYPFIALLCVLFTPISAILIGIRKLASMLIKNKDESVITEDEIITFVEEAELEGGIDEQESELIRSAVEFNDLEAQEILTHRVDLVAISDDEELDKIDSYFRDTGFSRLPVYSETIDNIIGVIHHKDFYNKVRAGECSLEEAADNLRRATRRYAKRQLTWFRRDERINWICIDQSPDVVGEAVEITEKWRNEE